MQFSQPNGLEHYGQPVFHTQCQYNGYPVIVGEGTVTSVTSPDGSTQLLFLPTAHWPRPQPAPYNWHLNNPQLNNTAAWFVRCISSPFQPTLCSQPHPALWGVSPYPRGSNSDCNLTYPTHPFQLKFHNDISTSTSDIHHFCPKQYNWFLKPHGCAAIQTMLPLPMTTTSIDHHEVVCTKPCNCVTNPPCTCTKQTDGLVRNKCYPKKSNTNSDMSCDDSKTNVCAEKEHRKKSLLKRTKRSSRECPCKERTGLNKSVVTYADQASGSVEEKGRETQTVICASPIKIKSEDFSKKLKLESRGSKIYRKERTAAESRASLSGACDSQCCSGSCSCNSLTD